MTWRKTKMCGAIIINIPKVTKIMYADAFILKRYSLQISNKYLIARSISCDVKLL